MPDRSGSGRVASPTVLPASPTVLPASTAGSDRRNVLDRAHRGDIEGALGRVATHEPPGGRNLRRRLATFLIIMGPGLVVMAANVDAGSLSTFAQAGQDYGLKWIWLPIVLAGVLFVIQEMVARLGAVTGAGHARLIFERFGRAWGVFALGDLIILDVLTIVTEFIGLQFGLGYFGVSRYIAIPAAWAGLLALGMVGSFRRWELVAFTLIGVSLLATPLLLLAQAHKVGRLPSDLVMHHPVSGQGALFALALIGTTVAPWQIFFQQANVVDKRITPRWLGYERTDTLVGTAVFAFCATALIAGCAALLHGSVLGGRFVDAGTVASALQIRGGSWAGTLFAVALIDGSILGAGVVSLATGYAVGEVSGTRHSLHRRWGDARTFYGVQAACVTGAAMIVLAADHDLGFITLAVQALSGILFPSAAVLLLMLCNDRQVLGPWVNRLWHNCVAAVLVSALLVLSAITTLRTAFPHLDERWTISTATVAVVMGIAALAVSADRRPAVRASAPGPGPHRATWSMPPIEGLAPPGPSRVRTASLSILRAYIGVSVVALAITFARGA